MRRSGPDAVLGQEIAPLTAPHHQHHHGQREEDGDEDEEGERVVRRVDEHRVLQAAVGEEVFVDADDEALHRWVRPEASDALGVHLRAEGEDVILSDEVREVASVFWMNVIHVAAELFSASLHLQQQDGLIALQEPRPLGERQINAVCI